jgi:RNA-directed DNA polymerase
MGIGDSDHSIVPLKLGNQPEGPSGGKRCVGFMELLMGKTTGLSEPITVSTKQQRIADLAKTAPSMAMDLSHHMDQEWFVEAYKRTRKDGAVGIDGVSGKEYGEGVDARLRDLVDRAKSGTYRAPAVRRVHIPKGDGKQTRPLGIPTFEDKVLQRAVAMALTPVYEQDFLDCSYGFRPGRSAHHALQALWSGLMSMGGGYVIDLDIKSYFDTVEHRQVQELVSKRVRDGVVRRLIGKWLNAGVLEKGQKTYSGSGVPQGGVISPLLSNIYLHEVLDKWFVEQVLPRMKATAFMVRYADDAVLVFANKSDADKIFDVLPKRFAKFGLTLHPDKTRLIDFQRGPRRDSFDFLGFTHFWGMSRKGKPVVKRKTARKRFNRGLRAIGSWLEVVRHQPISQQHKLLSQKLRGHNQYYGITGNGQSLAAFVYWVMHLWRKSLGRRSYKAKRNWEWFRHLLKRFPLPKPTPVHSVLRHAANP